MNDDAPDEPPATEQFQVKEKLGQGGFGTVYRAYDTRAEQFVALKLLHRRDPEALLRFKEEFRNLVPLSHPNLVSLYELHQEGQRWFFTMEFIEGRALQESGSGGVSSLSREETLGRPFPTPSPERPAPGSLAEGLSPAVAGGTSLPSSGARPPSGHDRTLRDRFRQLAEGIGWLHRCGQLHCDLKPSNVMVEDGGRVVLLDFGLLQPLGPSVHPIEHSPGLAGTPQFMAPEVCAGRSPTAASDWYSYGVMLYFALTGTLPFRGRSLNVVMAKQVHDAVPASQIAGGIPPDLDHLCSSLLGRDPGSRPRYEEIASVLRGSSTPSTALGSTVARAEPSTPFLGRDAELRRLAATRARPGLSIALVSGPSGYGKTALTERFLESVPDETWVLRSRCYERGTVAYKALDGSVDRLSAYLRALPSADWEAMRPADMWALARVFRVLDDLPHPDPPPVAGVMSAQQTRRRAHVALRQLLGSLKRDVLLVIDDLQWADDDSVAMLSELVNPSESAHPPPITLVAMVRSDETGDVLRRILEQLETARQVEHIDLGPMQEEHARALAAALLGSARERPDPLIERLVHASEGSPLFLEELVRHHGEAGDAERAQGELSAMIRRRVQRLPDWPRRVVELVAVAGQPLSDAHVLAALGGDRPADGLKHLSTLRQQRLVRTTAAALIAPYHDRIRGAVVGGLGLGTLRERHLALARAAVSHRGDDPEFIAVHFRAGGEPEAAVDYLVAAGDRAFETLAFDRAARHYREALALRDDLDGQVSVHLAESLRNAGRGIESAEAFLAAAERVSRHEEAYRLRIAAVEQLLFAGAYDEGEAVIREVLGTLGLKVAGSMPAAFADLAWQSLKLKRRGQESTPRAERELPAPTRHHIDILWSATIGLSMANPVASQAIQKRHLMAALDGGEPFRLGRALSIELAFSGIPGGRDETLSQELSRRGHALVDRIDDHYSKPFMSMSDGAVHWLRGRWQAAHDAFHSSLTAYRERCTGVRWEIDTAQFVVLDTRARMGELASVRSEVPPLLADAVERGDLYFETQVRTRFSPLLATLCEDQPDTAIRDLSEAIARWTPRGYHIVHFWTLISHVEALLYAGRGVEALRRLRAEELALYRSLLLTGQYYRVQYHDLRARSSLAAAHEVGASGLRGRLLLARASFHTQRLLREDMPWARALGRLSSASIRLARDDDAGARIAFADAARETEAVNMKLHAAVARRRAAELRGEAAEDVDAWLRTQAVARPEAICGVLAPRG